MTKEVLDKANTFVINAETRRLGNLLDTQKEQEEKLIRVEKNVDVCDPESIDFYEKERARLGQATKALEKELRRLDPKDKYDQEEVQIYNIVRKRRK
jgi:hypothetical protein